MNSYKRWVIFTLMGTFIAGGILGALTIVIDPFFHYHSPLANLEYPINNERYQNNGIVKHFDYDTIITGTSMTQNFKTSECESLFGGIAIKVPFSGASYREINANLERAINANSNIKRIIRCLDYNSLLRDKDVLNYTSYPDYLYDEKMWNDVSYIFNKDVLFSNTLPVISYTRSGKKTTDFDTYANWMSWYSFGKEAVDKTYSRRTEKAKVREVFSEENQSVLKENISQNVIDLAKNNPDIDFYLFFSPYSIYYWDSVNQQGTLNQQLEAEKLAIEMLIEYDNIRLFSFFDKFDMICDLNNYKDAIHYSEDINSQILVWMHDEENQLTKDNYLAYCERIKEFYSTYDYDSLFQ